MSLGIVAVIGAVVIGGTIAWLSDVEKSTGNTFAAGPFDLTIDSDCHFNGMNCVCPSGWTYCYWDQNNNGTIEGDETAVENRCDCKWDDRDLTDEKFFNLANLIPGDQGEVTISMHVEGDDYYARSKVDNVKNKDNGCNDPEKEAGDTTCGNPGTNTSGELGANMDFAFWADMGSIWGYQNDGTDPQEGDNILNSEYEYLSLSITSGDDPAGVWIESGIKFRDGATYYMGVAWCVGDINVDSAPDYAMTCDGSSVTNIIQTDSYSSDMTFQVVQATHNDATPFDDND